jgi:CDP-diglyceride synthetase
MVLANTLHIIVVKNNWLSAFNIPISAKAFGENKTIRGFFVLPFFSGGLVAIFSYLWGPFMHSFLMDVFIGLGLGICYLLSELPNSYVKRKLGIKNGEHSKKNKGVQMLIDKADSLVGMLLFYYLVTPISLLETFKLFLLTLIISSSVSLLLLVLKLKKSF